MASLTFAKKEKIKQLVSEALALEDATSPAVTPGERSCKPSSGVSAALAYVSNAAKDIRVG